MGGTRTGAQKPVPGIGAGSKGAPIDTERWKPTKHRLAEAAHVEYLVGGVFPVGDLGGAWTVHAII